MTNLIVTFRNYANAPNNLQCIWLKGDWRQTPFGPTVQAAGVRGHKISGQLHILCGQANPQKSLTPHYLFC